ncbi:SLC13 family permease [Adlercreutzia sp. ZJ141]|uniref:SLC13 family permease n=1 Tax=Adlercreutzia sp. ZJ141 TaxID=2709406 RepID=UPI0013EC9629|nr:SLC13 family permease [Adlercreutzia sp. ZJ141]
MRRLASRAAGFVRSQPVLCCAFAAAVLSQVVSPQGAQVAGLIDWQVIGLLACFMVCTAALQQANALSWLAFRLVRGDMSLSTLMLSLVLLPFFASMVVTNDVALLAFVPFACAVLRASGEQRLVVPVLVLQTLAANMGSMATPFGNPQNLLLFKGFGLDAAEFFVVVIPYVGLSFVLIVVFCLVAGRYRAVKPFCGQLPLVDVRKTAAAGVLFALCVATVFDVVPLNMTLVCAVVFALACDGIELLRSRECLVVMSDKGGKPLQGRGREQNETVSSDGGGPLRKRECGDVVGGGTLIIARIDYALLLTFACFFVFSGTLAASDAVRQVLSGALSEHSFLIPLAASQVISNVPAAALLMPFATSWQQLVLGVDIGGLGTPVASLASLITLGIYRKESCGSTVQFLRAFLLANAALLAANCALWLLLN